MSRTSDFSSEQKAASNSSSPEKTLFTAAAFAASSRLASVHGSLPSLAITSNACDAAGADETSWRRGRHTRHASLQNERERQLLSTIHEDVPPISPVAGAAAPSTACESKSTAQARALALTQFLTSSGRTPTGPPEKSDGPDVRSRRHALTLIASVAVSPSASGLPSSAAVPAVRPDVLSPAFAQNHSHNRTLLLNHSNTAAPLFTLDATPSSLNARDADPSQQAPSSRLFVPTHKRSHTATSIDSDISDEFSVAVPQQLLLRGLAIQLQAASSQPTPTTVLLECNCHPEQKQAGAHTASVVGVRVASGATPHESHNHRTAQLSAAGGAPNQQQLYARRVEEVPASGSALQGQEQAQPLLQLQPPATTTLPLATTKHACPFHTALLCGSQLKRYVIPKSTPKSPQRLAMEQIGRNWPKSMSIASKYASSSSSRGAKLPTIQSTSNVPSLDTSAASSSNDEQNVRVHIVDPNADADATPTPVLSHRLPNANANAYTAAPDSDRSQSDTDPSSPLVRSLATCQADDTQRSCVIRLPGDLELADIDCSPDNTDDAFAVALSPENGGGVRCSRQQPLQCAGAACDAGARDDRSARSSASDNFVDASGTGGALPTPESHGPNPGFEPADGSGPEATTGSGTCSGTGSDTGTSTSPQAARADAIDSLLIGASPASASANALAVHPTRSPRISQPQSEIGIGMATGLTPRRHCDGCFQVCPRHASTHLLIGCQ